MKSIKTWWRRWFTRKRRACIGAVRFEIIPEARRGVVAVLGLEIVLETRLALCSHVSLLVPDPLVVRGTGANKMGLFGRHVSERQALPSVSVRQVFPSSVERAH